MDESVGTSAVLLTFLSQMAVCGVLPTLPSHGDTSVAAML